MSSATKWLTATAYVRNQYVYHVLQNIGSVYKCIAAHTSGTDEDEPGVGAEWQDFWALYQDQC